MNDGTTKLPDNKPAEDGGELMAEEPEEVELDSMFFRRCVTRHQSPCIRGVALHDHQKNVR